MPYSPKPSLFPLQIPLFNSRRRAHSEGLKDMLFFMSGTVQTSGLDENIPLGTLNSNDTGINWDFSNYYEYQTGTALVTRARSPWVIGSRDFLDVFGAALTRARMSSAEDRSGHALFRSSGSDDGETNPYLPGNEVTGYARGFNYQLRNGLISVRPETDGGPHILSLPGSGASYDISTVPDYADGAIVIDPAVFAPKSTYTNLDYAILKKIGTKFQNQSDPEAGRPYWNPEVGDYYCRTVKTTSLFDKIEEVTWPDPDRPSETRLVSSADGSDSGVSFFSWFNNEVIDQNLVESAAKLMPRDIQNLTFYSYGNHPWGDIGFSGGAASTYSDLDGSSIVKEINEGKREDAPDVNSATFEDLRGYLQEIKEAVENTDNKYGDLKYKDFVHPESTFDKIIGLFGDAAATDTHLANLRTYAATGGGDRQLALEDAVKVVGLAQEIMAEMENLYTAFTAALGPIYGAGGEKWNQIDGCSNVNEDWNANGVLDPWEDLNANRHLDVWENRSFDYAVYNYEYDYRAFNNDVFLSDLSAAPLPVSRWVFQSPYDTGGLSTTAMPANFNIRGLMRPALPVWASDIGLVGGYTETDYQFQQGYIDSYWAPVPLNSFFRKMPSQLIYECGSDGVPTISTDTDGTEHLVLNENGRQSAFNYLAKLGEYYEGEFRRGDTSAAGYFFNHMSVYNLQLLADILPKLYGLSQVLGGIFGAEDIKGVPKLGGWKNGAGVNEEIWYIDNDKVNDWREKVTGIDEPVIKVEGMSRIWAKLFYNVPANANEAQFIEHIVSLEAAGTIGQRKDGETDKAFANRMIVEAWSILRSGGDIDKDGKFGTAGGEEAEEASVLLDAPYLPTIGDGHSGPETEKANLGRLLTSLGHTSADDIVKIWYDQIVVPAEKPKADAIPPELKAFFIANVPTTDWETGGPAYDPITVHPDSDADHSPMPRAITGDSEGSYWNPDGKTLKAKPKDEYELIWDNKDFVGFRIQLAETDPRLNSGRHFQDALRLSIASIIRELGGEKEETKILKTLGEINRLSGRDVDFSLVVSKEKLASGITSLYREINGADAAGYYRPAYDTSIAGSRDAGKNRYWRQETVDFSDFSDLSGVFNINLPAGGSYAAAFSDSGDNADRVHFYNTAAVSSFLSLHQVISAALPDLASEEVLNRIYDTAYSPGRGEIITNNSYLAYLLAGEYDDSGAYIEQYLRSGPSFEPTTSARGISAGRYKSTGVGGLYWDSSYDYNFQNMSWSEMMKEGFSGTSNVTDDELIGSYEREDFENALVWDSEDIYIGSEHGDSDDIPPESDIGTACGQYIGVKESGATHYYKIIYDCQGGTPHWAGAPSSWDEVAADDRYHSTFAQPIYWAMDGYPAGTLPASAEIGIDPGQYLKTSDGEYHLVVTRQEAVRKSHDLVADGSTLKLKTGFQTSRQHYLDDSTTESRGIYWQLISACDTIPAGAESGDQPGDYIKIGEKYYLIVAETTALDDSGQLNTDYSGTSIQPFYWHDGTYSEAAATFDPSVTPLPGVIRAEAFEAYSGYQDYVGIEEGQYIKMLDPDGANYCYHLVCAPEEAIQSFTLYEGGSEHAPKYIGLYQEGGAVTQIGGISLKAGERPGGLADAATEYAIEVDDDFDFANLKVYRRISRGTVLGASGSFDLKNDGDRSGANDFFALNIDTGRIQTQNVAITQPIYLEVSPDTAGSSLEEGASLISLNSGYLCWDGTNIKETITLADLNDIHREVFRTVSLTDGTEAANVNGVDGIGDNWIIEDEIYYSGEDGDSRNESDMGLIKAGDLKGQYYVTTAVEATTRGITKLNTTLNYGDGSSNFFEFDYDGDGTRDKLSDSGLIEFLAKLAGDFGITANQADNSDSDWAEDGEAFFDASFYGLINGRIYYERSRPAVIIGSGRADFLDYDTEDAFLAAASASGESRRSLERAAPTGPDDPIRFTPRTFLLYAPPTSGETGRSDYAFAPNDDFITYESSINGYHGVELNPFSLLNSFAQYYHGAAPRDPGYTDSRDNLLRQSLAGLDITSKDIFKGYIGEGAEAFDLTKVPFYRLMFYFGKTSEMIYTTVVCKGLINKMFRNQNQLANERYREEKDREEWSEQIRQQHLSRERSQRNAALQRALAKKKASNNQNKGRASRTAGKESR